VENFVSCVKKITLAAFKIIRERPQIVRADDEIGRAPLKSPVRGKRCSVRAMKFSVRRKSWLVAVRKDAVQAIK
jgi:hypothetical protein